MKVISGGLKTRITNNTIYGEGKYMAEKCFNDYKAVYLSYADGNEFSYVTAYDAGRISNEARLGNLRAVFQMGFMLENGIFYSRNPEKAFCWYEKGAKKDDADCQLALFYMYRLGNGVNFNLHKAVFWLKLSAENGNSTAMFLLGQIYIEGVIEEFNGEEAMYWLRRAADLGCGEAMLNLGVIAEKGNCMPSDATAAFNWYLKAAKLNIDEARIYLAELVFREFKGEEKYVKTAVRYLNKLVRAGNGEALFLLGAYYKSLGGAYYKKAFGLLKKSADKCCNLLAALELADMYETGCGVKADNEKALEYYNKVLELV